MAFSRHSVTNLTVSGRLTLQDMAARCAAKNISSYNEADIDCLPNVLLALLVEQLSVEELLRLHPLFTRRAVATDSVWQLHYNTRWKQHDIKSTHGTFICNRQSYINQYVNRHVGEIFTSILDGRWSRAWHRFMEFRDDDYEISLRLSDDITEQEKFAILNDVKKFVPYVTRIILNCRYISRLHPYWMIIFQNVKSIRLIDLFSSLTSFSLGLRLIHSIRKFGNLEEINVSHSKEDNGYETFALFCASASCRESDSILETVPQPNQLPKYFLSVCSLDKTQCESLYTKKDTDSFSQNSEQNFHYDGLCVFPEGDEMLDRSSTVTDNSFALDSDDSIDFVDDLDLYDSALLEPLLCPPKLTGPVHEISKELETLYARCIEDVSINFERGCYAKIKFISLSNPDLTDFILQQVNCWPHLVSLATSEGLIRWGASSEDIQKQADAITSLLSNEQFLELHADFNALQTACSYRMLCHLKRKSPLKLLHLSRTSEMILEPVLPTTFFTNLADQFEHMSVTERVCYDGDSNYRLLPILRILVQHDSALKHFEYTGSHIGNMWLLELLGILHGRVNKGYDLQTLNLSDTRQMGQALQEEDFFLTPLSPVRIQTLVSLNLSHSHIKEMSCLTTVFLDDILSHPCLQELYITHNTLGEAGCFLLEKLSIAIIQRTSKIRILDMACNRMPGQKLTDVASQISHFLNDENATSVPMGWRLDLSFNHFYKTSRDPVVQALSRVFKQVHCSIFDFTVDVNALEHVAVM